MKSHNNPTANIINRILFSICHTVGVIFVLIISLGKVTCEKYHFRDEFNDTDLDWSLFIEKENSKELKQGIVQGIGFMFFLSIYLLAQYTN